MSNIAIKLENVSKQYRLGVVNTQTLKADVQRWIARLKGKEDPFLKVGMENVLAKNNNQSNLKTNKKLETEYVWALRDINLEVFQGQVLGIIGKNGAGKSTLLKLLSRVTAPTIGEIKVAGRIASLLEVGTGFHPELTGRENIFLNGAILGMTKTEIKSKFDEIVDFSGVEKYIDTPVKRYSSGMYVRLAFAVAAHLDPEVLIVDEVLAVGDADFQKKAIGKMQDVSKGEGRTVLFVSHNMNAISELCNDCVLMREGKIFKHSNDVDALINDYLFQNNFITEKSYWENQGNQFINEIFVPLRMFFSNQDNQIIEGTVRNDNDVYFNLEIDVTALNPALTLGYIVYNENHQVMYWSYFTDIEEKRWGTIKIGRNTLISKIPKRILNQGNYRFEILASIHFVKWLYKLEDDKPTIYLNIQGGLSDSPFWMNKRPGLIAPVIEWEIKHT